MRPCSPGTAVPAVAAAVVAPVRPAGRRDRAGGGLRAVPRQRDPGRDGDDGERRPHAQAQPPAAAHGVGERHGDGRGDGGAERQGHRVDAGHGADPVREVPLDDHRHEHVGDRDAGQGEGAGGEEDHGAAGERPQREARGQRGHAREDDGPRAVPAGQPRRGEPEEREARGGPGGEQAGSGAAHAEAVAHLLQERTEAGDGGAEVHGGEDEADDHEPAHPGRGRRRGDRRGEGVRAGRGGRAGVVRGRGGRVEGEGVVVAHHTIIE
jgi:hypothetical protein